MDDAGLVDRLREDVWGAQTWFLPAKQRNYINRTGFAHPTGSMDGLVEMLAADDLYPGRGAGERTFGRLKHEWGLAPLCVRGLDKIALHAGRCILATLAALARARAVPLAA